MSSELERIREWKQLAQKYNLSCRLTNDFIYLRVDKTEWQISLQSKLGKQNQKHYEVFGLDFATKKPRIKKNGKREIYIVTGPEDFDAKFKLFERKFQIKKPLSKKPISQQKYESKADRIANSFISIPNSQSLITLNPPGTHKSTVNVPLTTNYYDFPHIDKNVNKPDTYNKVICLIPHATLASISLVQETDRKILALPFCKRVDLLQTLIVCPKVVLDCKGKLIRLTFLWENHILVRKAKMQYSAQLYVLLALEENKQCLPLLEL